MVPGAVTVCVPVWNAERFLDETLDGIAAQSLGDFRVLLALDRSDDGSEAICRRRLADPRFRLIVQPQRLGWVGNTNALIAAVETEFFCIIPHDDLLRPAYLARLLDVARRDVAAAAVYSDIETFGDDGFHVIQPEVRGDRLRRLLDVLLNHDDSVAFRGLVRRRSPDDRPFLPTGIAGDFAADTVWLVELAARGELRRVPGGLYRKRLHPTSAHAEWGRWPPDRRRAAWIEQAVRMATLAAARLDRPDERALAVLAAAARLSGLGAVERPPIDRAALHRVHEVASFAARIVPLAVPDDLAAALADPRAAPIRAARFLISARDRAHKDEREAALDLLAQARQVDPLSGHATAMASRLLLEQAKAAIVARDLAAARPPAAAALELDPEGYHPNLVHAELLIADGDEAAALTVLRRLERLWPGTRPVAQRLRRLLPPQPPGDRPIDASDRAAPP